MDVSLFQLLCSLAALSTAYVLVHQQPPPTVVHQTPQVVYHAQPPVVGGGGQPPIVVGPGGQPSVVYHHFAPGGVRPQLQPPVVLVRVVPGLLPPQQPPQPPFIEEVPPVFKNPPSDEDDSPKPRQRPNGRPGNGHGPNCAGVDNKKGIAPPPTRKPSKQGRDVNPRTARKNPEKEGPRNPNRKHSRRPNPKSERIRSERLTLPKSG